MVSKESKLLIWKLFAVILKCFKSLLTLFNIMFTVFNCCCGSNACLEFVVGLLSTNPCQPGGAGGNHSSSTALPAQLIVWMKHSQQKNTFVDFADVVQRSCAAMSGEKAFTEHMVPVLVTLMLVCNLNSVWGFCLVLSLCRPFCLPLDELLYYVYALPLIWRK